MESQRRLLAIKNFILDLIFPKECLVCAQEGGYLCGQCLNKIILNQQLYCVFCGKKIFNNEICQDCSKNSALRAVFVVADYNNQIIQDLLHNLKYNYLEDISQILGLLSSRYLVEQNLLSRFDLNSNNTILVTIPLHHKRYLSRGFNQGDLLADQLTLNHGFLKVNLVERIINTVCQISLTRAQRQQNVKNAFVLSKSAFLTNKKVILIDDVVTTGSTLTECAKVLAAAGFEEIYALVIAHRQD